ncbi:hypothetical protein [Neptunicella marina]|uniref:Uncharacterized protein n=1 Tax=Neptunicella marina TaxID=2125989 RepID=A0A8J6IST7_9ALTE|nr:hypothetical protein [Neptunicella marina]MBC3765197.1 hypothetical protein [Neptunicella marina]
MSSVRKFSWKINGVGRSFIKRHRFLVFCGVFVYGIWVLLTLIYANIIFTDVNWLDSLFGRVNNSSSDFVVSYAASALDSLIFFITVGFILAVISFKRPEEENLSTKIEYIFSGVSSDTKLGKYLAKNISSLACVSSETTRLIAIREYNDKHKTVKVLSKVHCIVKNIYHNHDFVSESMKFSYKIDDEVTCDDDVLGEIIDVVVIKDLNNSKESQQILKTAHELTADKRVYENSFELKLKEQEEAVYKTCNWAWQRVDKALSFSPGRFTEKQVFNIVNETNVQLEVSIVAPDSPKKKVVLGADGGEESFEVGPTQPGEKVSISDMTISP